MVKEELNQDSSQSENLQSAEAQPDAQTASQTALSEAENEQITKPKSEGSDKQTEQEEAASRKLKQIKRENKRKKSTPVQNRKKWRFLRIGCLRQFCRSSYRESFVRLQYIFSFRPTTLPREGLRVRQSCSNM